MILLQKRSRTMKTGWLPSMRIIVTRSYRLINLDLVTTFSSNLLSIAYVTSKPVAKTGMQEDVSIMKVIGFNAYRFSISWSRLLPSYGPYSYTLYLYIYIVHQISYHSNNILMFVTLYCRREFKWGCKPRRRR